MIYLVYTRTNAVQGNIKINKYDRYLPGGKIPSVNLVPPIGAIVLQ